MFFIVGQVCGERKRRDQHGLRHEQSQKDCQGHQPQVSKHDL
jgi:hypothetical protein